MSTTKPKKNHKPHEFKPLELECQQYGYKMIAGVDEAGRGPLAGPLSVGLVLFPYDFLSSPLPAELHTLNDSKQLTATVRETLYAVLGRFSSFQCTVHISNRLVDRWGINVATEFALIRACKRAELFHCKPDMILMDGNYKFPNFYRLMPEIHYRSVIGGDGSVVSIAAASIMAKVSRDRRMLRYATLFPGYGLEQHKGYGTKKHRDSIAQLGPCGLHRRTYLSSKDAADEQLSFI